MKLLAAFLIGGTIMKRYVRLNSNDGTVKVEVIFEVELMPDETGGQVAAATYEGIEIPEGELPPADKDVIMNSQVYSDYIAFIESVEDILVDYYELNIYYKNKSDYDSFYWGCLAKDDNGNLLFDFEVTLRVSTHPAHRTKESQNKKKVQKQELAKISSKKRVKNIRIDVVVNNESVDFDSYLDAIEYLDKRLEKAVEIMKRRNK